MTTISLVTPVNCQKIENLSFTEYLFIYLDKDSKLKRAIPDFNEMYMGYESSLILETVDAEKVATFKIVRRDQAIKEELPVFYIYTDDNGEITNHSSFGDNIVSLERMVYAFDDKETVSKLLKKTK